MLARIEPVKFCSDKDLDGIHEIPTRGRVVELGPFPVRFSNAVFATESGLWRLYTWNTGIWKRRAGPKPPDHPAPGAAA